MSFTVGQGTAAIFSHIAALPESQEKGLTVCSVRTGMTGMAYILRGKSDLTGVDTCRWTLCSRNWTR